MRFYRKYVPIQGLGVGLIWGNYSMDHSSTLYKHLQNTKTDRETPAALLEYLVLFKSTCVNIVESHAV